MLHATETQKEGDHSPFVVVGGLQYVRPYESSSVYRVKGERYGDMKDEEILAVMCPQAPEIDGRDASVEFWRGELASERVVAVAASDGDLRQLVVTRHVHEQVVAATDVEVIYEDEHFLAINKPAGMPTLNEIQGVGLNTALGVMQQRSGSCCKLVPMHRLDKPVGGVLLMVKTQAGKQVRDPRVRKIQKHIAKHKVTKLYLARVLGAFPPQVTCTAPLLWCDKDELGLASVSREAGKESETRFTLLRSDVTSSLVLCQPITGTK